MFMKVKELIKVLADFNPECEITNTIDIGWSTGDFEPSCSNGNRDIEKEKLEATHLTLFYGIDGDEKSENRISLKEEKNKLPMIDKGDGDERNQIHFV